MSASGPLNLLIYLIIIVIFLVVLFWILDRFLFFVVGYAETQGHAPPVTTANPPLTIAQKYTYSDYRFPFYLSLIGF